MRTKALNHNSMNLIMENWRHYANSPSIDLEKLDERYEKFCQRAEKFMVLSESTKHNFLLEADEEDKEEGVPKKGWFSNIWSTGKEIAKAIGTSAKGFYKLLTSWNGLFYKLFEALDWSLTSFREIFDAVYGAIKAIQKDIFDILRKIPAVDKKTEAVKVWINNIKKERVEIMGDKKGNEDEICDPEEKKQGLCYKKVSGYGHLTRFVICGLLLCMWIYALSQGQAGEINPALILSALAGNFTVMELIEEGWFTKMLLAMAAGVALNMAFPGLGILSGGVIGALKIVSSLWKGGKTIAPAVKKGVEMYKGSKKAEPESV